MFLLLCYNHRISLSLDPHNPHTQDVTREETGANTETDKQFIYNTYTELLQNVDAKPGMTKAKPVRR